MNLWAGTVENFIFRQRHTGLNRQLTREGRQIRLTSVLDEATQRFEDELCRRTWVKGAEEDPPRIRADSGGVLLSAVRGDTVELPLHQRHAWLRHTGREFRLLQVSDAAGQPAMQAVIYIDRSRYLPMYGDGAVQRMGPAVSGEEEGYCLRLLRDLCTESGDLLSLRLQPRRAVGQDLLDFEGRARLCGYTLCEPYGVTRTLVVDLRMDTEEWLKSMTQKLRRKLRRRDKAQEFELRVLTEPRWIGACEAATRASVGRTGGPQRRRLEWQTMLAIAAERPELVRVIGIFHKDRPEQLLAVASACCHGRMAEYVSAGSLDDAQLRKEPFNYWLLWELFQWAKGNGALAMDLGGVTVGGPGDPLAGISRFKRHLSDLDVEVGREMMVMLRPYPGVLVNGVRTLRERWFDKVEPEPAADPDAVH